MSPADGRPHPPKVLFVAGMSRSGSTVLDLLLGELDGVVSCGELAFVWRLIDSEGAWCSCGHSLLACEQWSAVVDAVRGQGHDLGAVRSFFDDCVGLRVAQMLRLLGHLASQRGRRRIAAYARASLDLYHAVIRETGARVLVDSSKLPQVAQLIAPLLQTEMFIVHIVRDPRAVAYSHSLITRSRKPAGPHPAVGVIGSTLVWIGREVLLCNVLRRRFPGRYLTIRYEDLVLDPATAVQEIASASGLSDLRDRPAGSIGIPIQEQHIVGGNPGIRGRGGVGDVRPDERWKVAMRRRDRVVVTLLTAPLLRRRGYSLAQRRTGLGLRMSPS